MSESNEKGGFKAPPTQVTRRDAGEALLAVTGYSPETLTVLKSVLPKQVAADDAMVAAYVVTCKRLGIDLLQGGVYPVNMSGRFVPILHYSTMVGCAERSGELFNFSSSCVYDGEEFTFDPIKNEITHKADHVKRTGVPLGAWAMAERTDGKVFAYYISHADAKKSGTGGPTWGTSPDVMTEKVAIRRVLKRAFSPLFAGVYTEDEFDLKRNTFVRDEPPRVETTVEINANPPADTTATDLFEVTK